MPQVPNFQDQQRLQRVATDRFSVKNVIGSVHAQSVVPAPSQTPSVTPSNTCTPTQTLTPTPTITPTITLTPNTPTPTPTKTPAVTPTTMPAGYQTPPWNFTTYIQTSGASIGDALQTWRVTQFDADAALQGDRITYKANGSISYARVVLRVVGANHIWSRRDAEGLLIVQKIANPALSAQTITKLPGSADGWTNGEEYNSNITFYMSGFN